MAVRSSRRPAMHRTVTRPGTGRRGRAGVDFARDATGLVHDAGRNGSRLKRLTWTRRGGCVPYRGARRVTIENLQYLMINGHNLLIAKLAGHRRWRVLRLPPSRAMATRRSRHRWSGHVVGLSHQGPMRRGGSEAARRGYRRTRTHLRREIPSGGQGRSPESDSRALVPGIVMSVRSRELDGLSSCEFQNPRSDVNRPKWRRN